MKTLAILLSSILIQASPEAFASGIGVSYGRPSARPVKSASPTPVPGDDQSPERIDSTQPDWSIASGCKRFGSPIVTFLIQPSGVTTNHKISRSTGCPVADRKLLANIKKWRYRLKKGILEPISVTTVINISPH